MHLLSLWAQTNSYLFAFSSLSVPDCSDRAGGGGGVLLVLAPSSRSSPLGGVRDLPAEPGLLRVTGGCSLPGVQQLVSQPGHLRLPVGELQKGLQAGV